VRELQSVLKQSLLQMRGPALLPDFVPELSEAHGEPAPPVAPTAGGLDPEALIRRRLGPDSRDLNADFHQELDRLLLPLVLEHTGGNQQRAALLLVIARRTLGVKLQDVELHVTHSVATDEDNLP
jgi:two-component system nitrogen regulation response regulator GlnG